jgi:hypothetical protein
MRKDMIGLSVLTFLGLAGVIGLNVFASCLLAVGIVGAWCTSLRLLVSSRVGQDVLVTVASTAGATLAIAGGGGLIYLWSLALNQTFLWSLSLWSGILACGATWAIAAMWCEQHGRHLRLLRGIVA